MARKNKKYNKEFKLEAAKLVTRHGYSYAEVARQLGLDDWAIRDWVKTLMSQVIYRRSRITEPLQWRKI